MSRYINYKFRVNEEENNEIERLFKISKENNYSTFFRKQILQDKLYILPVQTFISIRYEIYKIGTNINQIAKKVNTYNYIDKSEIEYIKKGYEEILNKMNLIIEKIDEFEKLNK